MWLVDCCWVAGTGPGAAAKKHAEIWVDLVQFGMMRTMRRRRSTHFNFGWLIVVGTGRMVETRFD